MERPDRVESVAGNPRAVEEEGREAGVPGPFVVLRGGVADVERLVGRDAGRLERGLEDPPGRLRDADEGRDDDGVEVPGQVQPVEERRERGVPVADDEELQPPLPERGEDVEDLRVEAPALQPVEVGDELGEELLGERPPTDPREDLLDEAPPEAPLAVAAAPALLTPSLAFGDAAPGPAEGREDVLVGGGDAPAAERLAVDRLDGRVGREERVPRVEENRLRPLQGITCPPSMTIDCPVTFRASSEARYATIPAISSGTRTAPSGAIFPAAAKASSSSRPITLP